MLGGVVQPCTVDVLLSGNYARQRRFAEHNFGANAYISYSDPQLISHLKRQLYP